MHKDKFVFSQPIAFYLIIQLFRGPGLWGCEILLHMNTID